MGIQTRALLCTVCSGRTILCGEGDRGRIRAASISSIHLCTSPHLKGATSTSAAAPAPRRWLSRCRRTPCRDLALICPARLARHAHKSGPCAARARMDGVGKAHEPAILDQWVCEGWCGERAMCAVVPPDDLDEPLSVEDQGEGERCTNESKKWTRPGCVLCHPPHRGCGFLHSTQQGKYVVGCSGCRGPFGGIVDFFPGRAAVRSIAPISHAPWNAQRSSAPPPPT
eukprot:gene9251-biopygen18204